MWVLSDGGEQEKDKELKAFQERLQEIRKTRGFEEDDGYSEEIYLLDRKKVIWLMKTEIDDVLWYIEENGLESHLSQQEYDDIRELLKKLSSKLQEIDSTLENIFEQALLFNLWNSCD